MGEHNEVVQIIDLVPRRLTKMLERYKNDIERLDWAVIAQADAFRQIKVILVDLSDMLGHFYIVNVCGDAANTFIFADF